MIDALWQVYASPRTAGALLLSAGGIDLLLPDGSGALDGAMRGASALAALSLLAVALQLLSIRRRVDAGTRDAFEAAGLRRAAFVPYFERELGDEAVGRLRSWSGVAPVGWVAAWLVAVALALPALSALSGALWTEVATAQLETTRDVEFVRLERPAAGAVRNLGARVGLDAPALVRGEGELPDLRVRTAGGEGAVVQPLSPGRLAHAAGYAWSPQALVPGDAIGAVELAATPRGGGASVRVTLRRGPGVTLPDGTALRLVEGHPSYAGQLGPAVRVEETGPDGQIVRDDWIYGRFADFDGTHGSGRWILAVVGFALNHGVAVRAVRGLGAHGAMPPVVAVLAALVVLASLALLLVRVQRAGRDGDWQIVEWGARVDAGGPHALRRGVLTSSQLQQVAAIESRTGGGTP